MPQGLFPMPFQVDHMIAEKHGGETVVSNLALACPHRNLYKGPNIAGLDPASGQVVRLFHPRMCGVSILLGRERISRVAPQPAV
jgi:hypothetical protein